MEKGSAVSKETFGSRNPLGQNEQQAINRNAYRVTGEGDYRSALRAVTRAGLRAGGAAAGGALGGMFGQPVIGASIGRYAGRDISRLVGAGDYSIGNQLMPDESAAQTPMMVNSDDKTGDIEFSHSEFIGNVSVSGTGGSVSTFTSKSLAINPGLANTFPWLSQIAQNFTLYDFEGLVFEYRTTSGDGNASNALGKVVMATNYDPDATPFQSSVEAENYDYAMSCKPSVNMTHGIETDARQSVLANMYVRTGISAKDKSFTDLGLFQIITEGISLPGSGAVTMIVGELWAHYRVRLSRATLYGTILGNNIKMDAFLSSTATSDFFTNTRTFLPTSIYASTYAQPLLPDQGARSFESSLGGTWVKATGSTTTGSLYTFPQIISQGTYDILMTSAVYGSTACVQDAPILTNCKLATGLLANGSDSVVQNYDIHPLSSGGVTSFRQHFIVDVLAPGTTTATIQFRTGLIAANSVVQLVVTQVCTDCFNK